MSSSLILSATRGHLHSVRPNVAVSMSSLIYAANSFSQRIGSTSSQQTVNTASRATRSEFLTGELRLGFAWREPPVERQMRFMREHTSPARIDHAPGGLTADGRCESGRREVVEPLGEGTRARGDSEKQISVDKAVCGSDKAQEVRHRLDSPGPSDFLLFGVAAGGNSSHACHTKRCLALGSNRALNVTEMSMRSRADV